MNKYFFATPRDSCFQQGYQGNDERSAMTKPKRGPQTSQKRKTGASAGSVGPPINSSCGHWPPKPSVYRKTSKTKPNSGSQNSCGRLLLFYLSIFREKI